MLFAIEPSKSKARIYFLDILRVVACMAVVLIHASGTYTAENPNSFNFWAGNFFDGLSRIAVPLFIMISGALILDEKYSFTRSKLSKHIKRLLIFFLFWSVLYSIIYTIIPPLLRHQPIDSAKTINYLLQGHYHLWFIYLIIGLYLISPLLRLWVKKENKKYIKFFLVLSVIFAFLLPQIIKVTGYYNSSLATIDDILKNKLHLAYVGGYTSYFILGWYINNINIETKTKKLLYFLGIIGAIITILGTYMLSSSTGETLSLYGDLNINVLASSIAVFLFVRTKLAKTNPNKETKLVNIISKNSLGIYAIHPLFIEGAHLIMHSLNSNLAIINIPLIFIIAFSGSLITSVFLAKLPLLKKVV